VCHECHAIVCPLRRNERRHSIRPAPHRPPPLRRPPRHRPENPRQPPPPQPPPRRSTPHPNLPPNFLETFPPLHPLSSSAAPRREDHPMHTKAHHPITPARPAPRLNTPVIFHARLRTLPPTLAQLTPHQPLTTHSQKNTFAHLRKARRPLRTSPHPKLNTRKTFGRLSHLTTTPAQTPTYTTFHLATWPNPLATCPTPRPPFHNSPFPIHNAQLQFPPLCPKEPP
jgi:hypothetical protein